MYLRVPLSSDTPTWNAVFARECWFRVWWIARQTRRGGGRARRTPKVSRPSAVVMVFERALGESVKRGGETRMGCEVGWWWSDGELDSAGLCSLGGTMASDIPSRSERISSSTGTRLETHPVTCQFSLFMSSTAKPSLQGVRIKARKGAVKAHAKHEPAGTSLVLPFLHAHPLPAFRDQLYKHLDTISDTDFDAIANKLLQAGSTLEFLKYADALFEILLLGGLIQPGGSYVDDNAPMSPFSVFKASDPASIDDLKNYVQVLNKLIRRRAVPLPVRSRSFSPQIQVSSETSRRVCPSDAAPVLHSLVARAAAQVRHHGRTPHLSRHRYRSLPAESRKGPSGQEWCAP